MDKILSALKFSTFLTLAIVAVLVTVIGIIVGAVTLFGELIGVGVGIITIFFIAFFLIGLYPE